MSLDGFIARENGSLDWMFSVESEGDVGYSEFYATTDTMLMGKSTYEHVLSMVDTFPHSDRICYIFSRTENRPDPYVTYINSDPVAFTRELKAQEGKDIWLVGGSELADGIIKAKLVDEWIVTIVPIVLGRGIPLFKTNNPETELTLLRTTQYGQFAQLHYVTK
ncbi:dihydrofolate reductase family protein [Paenibacillus roseipurpureus]|uniref:Dihydrofolate reductase family protein n=1 Tax=Paenibacillus roseopurpureus TaxID=2918901 RepID=A0AA96LM93_9BACL|nr:dihydrofolate reductase family protein [Paenibacillus sp. MBLB1832]WNR42328.1 dihydrofolate reductase family protein [Paenibacillus sp. MBLB1832]